MNRLMYGTAVVAAALSIVAMPTSASAQDPAARKVTVLTFSAPVQLPGFDLPAGKYQFAIADPDDTRRVVEVRDEKGMKLYGFLLTIQDQRVEPTDDPVVLFRETPAGVARAVREWFYPGETIGYEFVYPKDQAVKIAKQTHERVLSSEETIDKADREHLHGAKVGRVDENGHFTSTSEEPAATSGSTSDTSKSKSTDK